VNDLHTPTYWNWYSPKYARGLIEFQIANLLTIAFEVAVCIYVADNFTTSHFRFQQEVVVLLKTYQ
jgi:hypothetical protein